MIAAELTQKGVDVTLRGTTLRTVFVVLKERRRDDAIIGTTRAGAIAGLALSSLYRRPLIVDHVDPISQLYSTGNEWVASVVERLENLTFASADWVLYVYEEEATRVGERALRATQTSLGLEYERFASPDDSVIDAAKARLSGLELEDDVAIYVGGLEPIYNIPACIAAFDHLDDWTLLLLGTGSLEAAVRERTAGLENVHFLGSVEHEEVPGYFHLADVGLCLVDDPHTLKVLEYLAGGLGVVQIEGRAEGKFDEAVDFTTGEPRDVARAIRAAKGHGATPETREYVRRFDWGTIAEDYRRAILNLVVSKKYN